MPVRRNRYYAGGQDQGVSQGLGNIASLFGPPNATDVLAYTRAGQMADEQRRQAAMVSTLRARYPGTPIADLFAGGVSDPAGQYQKLDIYNRAGQTGGDISKLDPYAYAMSHNYGNTAAGRREAETAQAERTKIDARNKLDIAMVSPVQRDAVRFAPPSIASFYGVPSVQTGVLEAGQGNSLTVPTEGGGERVIKGPEKPLTEDQVKAAVFVGLDPRRQQEAVYGSPTLTEIQGKGGKSVLQPALGAVGQQPAEDATDYKGSATGTIMGPDGKTPVGTAILHPDTGKWVESQSGTPIPQGTNIVPISVSAAKTDDLGGTATGNAEQKIMNIDAADAHLGRMIDLVNSNPGSQGLLGRLRGTWQNAIQTGGEVGSLLDASNRTLLQDAVKGTLPPEVVQRLGYKNGQFDPAIPAVEMARNAVISSYAKAMGNEGRQSDAAWARAEKALGAEGLLSNAPQTSAALGEMRNELAAERAVQARASAPAVKAFGPTSASGAAPAPIAPAAPAPAMGQPPALTPGVWQEGPGGIRIRLKPGQ